ncbi:unnamed protein product, partial [Aphanomyces euteiches]
RIACLLRPRRLKGLASSAISLPRDCPRRRSMPRQQQAKTRYPAPAPQRQAQSPRRFGRSPGLKGGPNRRVNFCQGNGGSK